MEYERVIGNRRSTRYFDPDRPVEREKVQKILEAMRLASCAMNAQWLRAVVVYREDLDAQTLEALKLPVSGVIMELAPVHIYCFTDPSVVPEDKGDRVRQLMDVGACNPSHGWTNAFLKDFVWPQVLKPLADNPTYPAAMAFDNGGAATQGLLMAINLGLGACWTVMAEDAARKYFGIPDHWLPHYLMNVGYSLENPGQRPRQPFGTQFFEGHVSKPFQRNEAVVGELKEAGMIQEPAPRSGRKEEIRELCKKLGLRE